jgi:hypothetical protein
LPGHGLHLAQYIPIFTDLIVDSAEPVKDCQLRIAMQQ